MLHATGVTKRYGHNLALDGVDLEIAPGEICGLVGPNGAGKTTFASIVAGLLRPDAGSVTVGGIDVTADPFEARRLLGYAPQDLGVYPLATAYENLLVFGELAGLRGGELDGRIEEVATALGLVALLGRQAGWLSGGEQRRLHTAMALLHRPALVLLDEPTVAADVATRATLLDFVRDLARQGAAVCYSTHYLTEVETLDASVALIDRGKIVASGTVTDLVDAHGDTAVELRFDGPPPRLRLGAPVEVVDDRLRITTRQPAADAARAMAALGAAADRLLGLEITRPSLETVFLHLTGKRLAEEEPAHVAS